jgi:hypothetical protein
MTFATPSVPPAVYARAMEALRCDSPKSQALLIADMSQPNSAPRLYVLDLSNPFQPTLVLQTHVAHGNGSDPRHTGWATRFSNVTDSEETALGAYHVAEQYRGADGSARYRLDGMSATDFNARPRNIVLHTAGYVHDDGTYTGWSEGCIAVSHLAMEVMDARLGSLTGAMIWVDGPGAPVPMCAPNTAPWWLPAKLCTGQMWWGHGDPKVCAERGKNSRSHPSGW